jgi:hypothetical protein
MPSLMLLYSFVSVFAYEYLSDKGYYLFYVLTDNLVGYSVGACIVFYYLYFISKPYENIAVETNKIITICLIIMNIVCFIYIFNGGNERYLFIYQITVVALVLLVKAIMVGKLIKKIHERI